MYEIRNNNCLEILRLCKTYTTQVENPSNKEFINSTDRNTMTNFLFDS